MTLRIPGMAAAAGVFRKPWLFYLFFLCFFTFFSLAWWPIQAGDTDLWYHLNAGRYILERQVQ